MGDINTNYVKERAEASINASIQNAKDKVAKKEEDYDIAKAMFEKSQRKLAAIKSQMNSSAYADNSDLKSQCSALEAEVSNNWINADVALGSLGNSRNYYSKISIFSCFMS